MPSPSTLSNLDIDRYSLKKAIADDLVANGWTTVVVDLAFDNWPVGVEISVPGVYISIDTNENTGLELGSFGIRRDVFVNVFGANDADRFRIAETIKDTFRKTIPVLDYVDGTETDPDPIGLLDVETIDYRPIRPLSTTPDRERWRCQVHATVVRND